MLIHDCGRAGKWVSIRTLVGGSNVCGTKARVERRREVFHALRSLSFAVANEGGCKSYDEQDHKGNYYSNNPA